MYSFADAIERGNLKIRNVRVLSLQTPARVTEAHHGTLGLAPLKDGQVPGRPLAELGGAGPAEMSLFIVEAVIELGRPGILVIILL